MYRTQRRLYGQTDDSEGVGSFLLSLVLHCMLSSTYPFNTSLVLMLIYMVSRAQSELIFMFTTSITLIKR